MCPVKILIRLRECAGWSETSLGASPKLRLPTLRLVYWTPFAFWLSRVKKENKPFVICNSECLDQTGLMRRLVRAYAIRFLDQQCLRTEMIDKPVWMRYRLWAINSQIAFFIRFVLARIDRRRMYSSLFSIFQCLTRIISHRDDSNNRPCLVCHKERSVTRKEFRKATMLLSKHNRHHIPR